MEQKLKDISKKAENLSKKIGNLQNENTIPVIELDIILRDIRTLYEEIKNLLAKTEGSVQEAAPVNVPQAKPAAVEASQEETSTAGLPQEEAPKAETPQAKAPVADEPPVEVLHAENPPSEVQGVKAAPESPGDGSKTEARGKSPEITTLGDKYKGGKSYINESLAGNIDKNDISRKIHSKPIQNIGSAMGLNDRFLLIRDLFNGDKDSFQNTVSVLDAAANFNEAFNYITSSFDWDMEEESVQLLLDLVRRKFIVNQNE